MQKTYVKKIYNRGNGTRKINYFFWIVVIVILIAIFAFVYILNKKTTSGNVVAKIEIGNEAKKDNSITGFAKNLFGKFKSKEIVSFFDIIKST